MPPGGSPRPPHDIPQPTFKRSYEQLGLDLNGLATTSTSSSSQSSSSDERNKRLRRGESQHRNEPDHITATHAGRSPVEPSSLRTGSHLPRRATPTLNGAPRTGSSTSLQSTQSAEQRFATFDREMEYLRSPRMTTPDPASHMSPVPLAQHRPPYTPFISLRDDAYELRRSSGHEVAQTSSSTMSLTPINSRFPANALDRSGPSTRPDFMDTQTRHGAGLETIMQNPNAWLRPSPGAEMMGDTNQPSISGSSMGIRGADANRIESNTINMPTREYHSAHSITLGRRSHSERRLQGASNAGAYVSGPLQLGRAQHVTRADLGQAATRETRQHNNEAGEVERSHDGDQIWPPRLLYSWVNESSPSSWMHERDDSWVSAPLSRQESPSTQQAISPPSQPFSSEDRRSFPPLSNSSSTIERRQAVFFSSESILHSHPTPSVSHSWDTTSTRTSTSDRVELHTSNESSIASPTDSALPESDLLDHLVEFSSSMNARLRRLESMMLHDQPARARVDSSSSFSDIGSPPRIDARDDTIREYAFPPIRHIYDGSDPTTISNLPPTNRLSRDPPPVESRPRAEAGPHAFMNRRPQIEAARRAAEITLQQHRLRRSVPRDNSLEHMADLANAEARSAVNRADEEIREAVSILQHDEVPRSTRRRGLPPAASRTVPPDYPLSSEGASNLSARRPNSLSSRMSTRGGRDQLSRPWPRREPPLRLRALGDFIDDESFDASYEGLLSLASLLGDVRPRGASIEVISRLPAATYERWATAESDKRCAICLEDYRSRDPVLRIPQCEHWMHKDCLEQWLHTSSTCPICRTSVNAETSNGSVTRDSQEHYINLPNSTGISGLLDSESFISMLPLPGAMHDLPPLNSQRPSARQFVPMPYLHPGASRDSHSAFRAWQAELSNQPRN